MVRERSLKSVLISFGSGWSRTFKQPNMNVASLTQQILEISEDALVDQSADCTSAPTRGQSAVVHLTDFIVIQ